MANPEQLEILKQGVEAWNEWRQKNPGVRIDLTETKLRGVNLGGILPNGANLIRADFSHTDLTGANLRRAQLNGAILLGANLTGASLWGAFFEVASLFGANLTEADLRRAYLNGTNLGGCNFRSTLFLGTVMGGTAIANSDLREALGLEGVEHQGPSSISTNTFARSNGKIPQVFLRGCGLSDWEIELVKLYNPNLSNDERNTILYKAYDLQASQAIQISPLFISYSHADSIFVNKLENQLNQRRIRFWRDVHDATSGRLEKVIDRAMRLNPTVLLILSEDAIKSDWVEHEVRTARDLEKEIGRDVLCPVALDDSWKRSSWPKRVMEQVMEYNILDFSDWKNDSRFEKTFNKLIDGLGLFYK